MKTTLTFQITQCLLILLLICAQHPLASAHARGYGNYEGYDYSDEGFDQDRWSGSEANMPRWLLTFGTGVAKADNKNGHDIEGFGGTIELNRHFFNHHLATLRLTGFFDFGKFLSNFGRAITFKQTGVAGRFSDVSILYGLINRGEYGYISAQTGISYFLKQSTRPVGADPSNPEYAEQHSIGLPLELQAIWHPFKSFGFGLIGTGNINKEATYWGLLFAVQLGF